MKPWLVRTANKEFEGPFSLDELVEAYKENRVKVTDFIALSGEKWISAQSLDCAHFREKQKAEPVIVTKVVKVEPKFEPMLWQLLATTFLVTVLLLSSGKSRKVEPPKDDASAASTLTSLIKRKDFKSALGFLEGRQAALAKSHSLKLIYAALSLRLNKNHDRVTEIISENAQTDELQFWKGYHQMRSSDFAGAADTLSSLVPSRPNNLPLHYNLAWAYLELGDHGKAQESFDRAWELDSRAITNSPLHRRISFGERGLTNFESLPLEYFVP